MKYTWIHGELPSSQDLAMHLHFLEVVAFLKAAMAETRDKCKVFFPLSCRCLCLISKTYLFVLTVYPVASPLFCV